MNNRHLRLTFTVILVIISFISYSQSIPAVSLEDLITDPAVKYGTIEVPLNHDAPEGKKIPLGYAIVPAKNESTGSPVILFTGGPGEFTVRNWQNYSQLPTVADRDLILFDQRGTGYSSGLYNMGPDVFNILAGNNTIEEEYQLMENLVIEYRDSIVDTGLELKYINTTQNAHDVGRLMDHLDYDKYIFFGGSYGTKIARRTMDLYPEYVESSVLMAPATWEEDFLTFRIRNFKRTLGLILDHCESDSECNELYPNLRTDYVEAIQALEKNPIEANINGQPFMINPQDAMYMLRYQLYTPQSKTMAPAFIKALHTRDTASINASQGFLSFVFNGVNFSMNISIGKYEEYNEDLIVENVMEHYDDPLYFPAPIGFFNSIYLASAKWHNGKASKDEITFKKSAIPALILVNKFDPVTPPQNGYDFLSTLSRGQLLVIDEGGHSGGGMCQWEVVIEFLSNPSKTVEAGCFRLIDKKMGWE